MTACRFALGAILSMSLASVAYAQPDPNEPTTPPADPTTAPTNDTTPTTPPPVVTEPGPTVIVNPPPAPTATVINQEPAYETVSDRWNAPVFTGGAILFLGSYGASAITAATLDRDERDRWADQLYIPVAGPWLALNDYTNGNCPRTDSTCDNSTATKGLLIADGVVQAVGVIGMVDGLLQPTYHRRAVRYTYDTKVHVRPGVVGRGGSGLHVFGRF